MQITYTAYRTSSMPNYYPYLHLIRLDDDASKLAVHSLSLSTTKLFATRKVWIQMRNAQIFKDRDKHNCRYRQIHLFRIDMPDSKYMITLNKTR